VVYSALKGRIGNNLFQIAAGLSLAEKNNTRFAAIVQKILLPQPDNCLLGVYLDQFKGNLLRNITFLDEIPAGTVKYNEPGFSYSTIEYQPNVILDGYFQSERYFDKELIRNTFSIDKQTHSYINSKYAEILSHEVTSVNVRRGDFTIVPEYHPVCSMSYFRNAIKYIGEKKLFLIISDDVEWCKKNFRNDNYFIVKDESPTVDLYLQSLCTNNIISNSSFSWWGAWLNPNPGKLVIAPSENWVGKLHPVQNTKDILPEEWFKLSNPLNYHIRIRVIYKKVFQMLVRLRKTLENKLSKHNG
jgi:hypothetical protein